MRDQFRLVGSSHQETPLVQDTRTSRVLVNFLANVLVEPVEEDVSKLVAAHYRLVVDIRDARDESRLRVVCEDEELTRRDGPIDAVERRFLHIAHDDSRADDVDRGDTGREALKWSEHRSRALVTNNGLTLFSHLRNSAFLPISYRRSDLPIPANRDPWKAARHIGMSSVFVCKRSAERNFKARYLADSPCAGTPNPDPAL